MDNDSQPDPPRPSPSTGSGQAGLAALWAELKRRKVVRVAVVYAIVAWLVIQIAATTFPSLYIPPWALTFVIMCVILGFPVALILPLTFREERGQTKVLHFRRPPLAVPYAQGRQICLISLSPLEFGFSLRRMQSR
jgi:hypothetical protein